MTRSRYAVVLGLSALVLVPFAALAQAGDDPSAMLEQLLAAIQGRNWIAVAGVALVLLTYLLRRWGGVYLPWLKTDRGGAALALGLGVLGSVGVALSAGTVTAQSLLDGAMLGLTSAGGYAVVRKLLFPVDAPKVEVKLPAAPPVSVVALLIAGALLVAAPARAQEPPPAAVPAVGGNVHLLGLELYLAPAVAATLTSIDLSSEGAMDTAFSPGLGAALTWNKGAWNSIGVGGYLNMVTTGKQSLTVSVLLSFLDGYLSAGIGQQLIGGGGTLVLLGPSLSL